MRPRISLGDGYVVGHGCLIRSDIIPTTPTDVAAPPRLDVKPMRRRIDRRAALHNRFGREIRMSEEDRTAFPHHHEGDVLKVPLKSRQVTTFRGSGEYARQ
jgi:hypothetical protein